MRCVLKTLRPLDFKHNKHRRKGGVQHVTNEKKNIMCTWSFGHKRHRRKGGAIFNKPKKTFHVLKALDFVHKE